MAHATSRLVVAVAMLASYRSQAHSQCCCNLWALLVDAPLPSFHTDLASLSRYGTPLETANLACSVEHVGGLVIKVITPPPTCMTSSWLTSVLAKVLKGACRISAFETAMQGGGLVYLLDLF